MSDTLLPMIDEHVQALGLIHIFLDQTMAIVLFGELPHARHLPQGARDLAALALFKTLPKELRDTYTVFIHVWSMGLL